MGKEIEHKYLVVGGDYAAMSTERHEISQGYLSRDPERTVRVRLRDSRAFLTVKGITEGDSREEFEYEIPFADGEAMLRLCTGRIVTKTRFIVPYGGHVWEVDRFGGDLGGLTLAEVELPRSAHDYLLPPFCGEEVTGDPKYYNSML